MPVIIHKSIDFDSKLGVWKLTEKLSDLEALFPFLPEEQKQYSQLKNDKRKREWIVTRILLTELLQKRVLIKYSKHGKPFIYKNYTKISISHSKNFVVVIVSARFDAGIDVEHIANRVEKVKHKFLHDEELRWCRNIELMTLCWSAKEAIFKIFEKELDFHDIAISEIDLNESFFNAQVTRKNINYTFRVYFDKCEDDVLTYTFRLN